MPLVDPTWRCATVVFQHCVLPSQVAAGLFYTVCSMTGTALGLPTMSMGKAGMGQPLAEDTLALCLGLRVRLEAD